MTASRSTRLLLLALSTFVLFMSTSVGKPVLPELAAELGAANSGAARAGGLTSLGCALAGDWRWLLAMRILTSGRAEG